MTCCDTDGTTENARCFADGISHWLCERDPDSLSRSDENAVDRF